MINPGAIPSEATAAGRAETEKLRAEIQGGKAANLSEDRLIGAFLHLAGLRYWASLDTFESDPDPSVRCPGYQSQGGQHGGQRRQR